MNRMWETRHGLLIKEREDREEKYRENWLARQSHATQAEVAKTGVEMLKKCAQQKEGERTSAILCLNLSKLGETLKRMEGTKISQNSMVLKEGETAANNTNNDNTLLNKSNKTIINNKMVLKQGMQDTIVLKGKEKVPNNDNNEAISASKSNKSVSNKKMVLKDNRMVLKEVEKGLNNNSIGRISVNNLKSMSMVLKGDMKQSKNCNNWCKYCKKCSYCINTNGNLYICSGKGSKGLGASFSEEESDK